MFLHDINYNNFNIALGDTLINPMHWDEEPFDAIVSNPPYSIRWDGKSNPLLINDPRFSPAGILAPESKADLAFTMHMLSWLSQKGTAAIVEFPGVLYRGGAEQKIRKYLIDNNFVDAIIQMPIDLFFGTSIATCIIVLKKSKSDNKILFIDASEEFIRGTNKSKLSDDNIENILELLKERKNIDRKSLLILNEEVKENDCNLSVNAYLKTDEEYVAIDIKEHNKKIKGIVEKQNKIRTELDEVIASIEGGSNE